MRFGIILSSLCRYIDSALLHRQKGFLAEDEWEGILYGIRSFLGLPGFQAFWAVRRQGFSAAFTQLIDSEIEKATVTPSATSIFLDAPSKDAPK